MPSHAELLAPLEKVNAAMLAGGGASERDSAWETALTDDVVWEAPFTDPPVYIAGRRAVGMLFDWLNSNVPTLETRLDGIHYIDDDESSIVQISGGGSVVGGGTYDQQYLSLIRIRDGRVAYFREHFKVAETYRAFGRERFHAAIDEINRKAGGD